MYLSSSMKYAFIILLLSGCNSLERFIHGREQPQQPTMAPTAPVEAPEGPTMPTKLPLYVGMGQSNMTGLDPATWPAGNYLTAPGNGSFYFFSTHFSTNVYFLQCSHSATFLVTWVNVYSNQCMDMIDADKYEVKGLIIYQGEADTQDDPQTTLEWASGWTSIINTFRARFGLVPVVMAQLGTHTAPYEKFPYWDHVKEEQASIVLPKFTLINTEGQPLVDIVHLTIAGYTEIGQRFYLAMQTLL